MTSSKPPSELLSHFPSHLISSPISNSHRTFPHFAQLPPEIRLMIWRSSMQSRLIEVHFTNSPHARYDYKYDIISDPPYFLQTCRESRKECMKSYHLPFQTSQATQTKRKIYFNLNLDVLHFRTDSTYPNSFGTYYDAQLERFIMNIPRKELIRNISFKNASTRYFCFPRYGGRAPRPRRFPLATLFPALEHILILDPVTEHPNPNPNRNCQHVQCRPNRSTIMPSSFHPSPVYSMMLKSWHKEGRGKKAPRYSWGSVCEGRIGEGDMVCGVLDEGYHMDRGYTCCGYKELVERRG